MKKLSSTILSIILMTTLASQAGTVVSGPTYRFNPRTQVGPTYRIGTPQINHAINTNNQRENPSYNNSGESQYYEQIRHYDGFGELKGKVKYFANGKVVVYNENGDITDTYYRTREHR